MARRDELDDDAPWLAEADPRARTEVSRRSLFWTVVVLLTLAMVAVIGLVLVFAKKDGGSTEGYMNAEQAPLIEAERSPYKIKPADPRGLVVEGQNGVIYDAGSGSDVPSTIDPASRPEEPLDRPGAAPADSGGPPQDLLPPAIVPEEAAIPAASAKAAPLPAPAAAKPVAPAVVAPKPVATVPPKPIVAAPLPAKPAAKAGSVQLGAFSSPEKAEAAWVALAGKYNLSGKRVLSVESGGKTLYRLRGSSADTAATCAAMKAGGDACQVIE